MNKREKEEFDFFEDQCESFYYQIEALVKERDDLKNKLKEAIQLLDDQPEEKYIWELMNKFATGETQKQWSRVEPLAVLGEAYGNFASARSHRQKFLEENKDMK